MRFKIIIIVIGVALCIIGVRELMVSSGTGSEPTAVKLAELEAGGALPSNYIVVDKHIAVYPAAVYSYRQERGATGEPSDGTTVEYSFHPLLSTSHPFITRLTELDEQYGGLENVPPDEDIAPPEQFAVLVKTRKFKTIGAIPDEMEPVEAVEGLVINNIDSLDNEEEKLVKESFPGLDMSKVWILEEDRKPGGVLKTWGAILGGGLLGLIGLGSFFVRPSAAA